MTALGIIGIIVGVAILIYGAYKGISTIILAPLCGLLIALFNGMNLLETFTDTMLPSTCNYVTAMLGPVMCGCVIAALYNKSGAALSIANALYSLFTIRARKKSSDGEPVIMRPILAIITIYVIGTTLAYSGMNPVVLMFILFPIAMDLFEKSLIPRAMGPGVVLGALATAACSMPGTTSDQNVIAVQMLGTSPMAAAIPGFIGGGVVLALNIVMMNIISKKQIAAGIVYTPPKQLEGRPTDVKTPHWILAVIPIAVTLICFNGLGLDILPSMMLNIILSLIFFFPYYGKFAGLKELLVPVGSQTTMLVLQVGLLGAIGGVVAASPAFPVLTNALLSMHGPALFKVLLAIALLTGASGSGPAGLSATLPYLSETFTNMGVSLNAIHRVSVFASQTLDTLPTNPGYIIATGIAEVEIKDSYKYVFITTVLNTTITAIVVALILTIFPC
ncbi:GntP family permease [Eubacterium oxidoreducens]|uniref:H+/gluconate symporter n=1 Tax=Eubacterium oxidoreducens TaxID=1732 RepID=A0A1G6A5H4_EUBOX|nr:GntP family permease [Eubacterium oxidoreducens]SDB03669.1 H+/gluconate symporter [Eubacterium oxidoreducens]